MSANKTFLLRQPVAGDPAAETWGQGIAHQKSTPQKSWWTFHFPAEFHMFSGIFNCIFTGISQWIFTGIFQQILTFVSSGVQSFVPSIFLSEGVCRRSVLFADAWNGDALRADHPTRRRQKLSGVDLLLAETSEFEPLRQKPKRNQSFSVICSGANLRVLMALC